MTTAETTAPSYERAIAAIDTAHAEDPRTIRHDGLSVPRELVYARRMSHWLNRLYPTASEALRLAVRAQHLRRWEIPRDSYPPGRDGYIRWRSHLRRHHARTVAEILERFGYDAETIARVKSLVRKRGVKTDPETQALEDAACLAFLECDLPEFAESHAPDKVIAILRKTWQKMSEDGRAAARQVSLPEDARALLERALAG